MIFSALGHTVEFLDLYTQEFSPVLGRRCHSMNVSLTGDDWLEKPDGCELDSCEPVLEEEWRRVQECDLLIFSFPLWCFGMPAILKGWVDRVFVTSRASGDPDFSIKPLGKTQKRALIIMTSAGGPESFGDYGPNPSMATILAPVQHGVFWSNGFFPLAPFVAWVRAQGPKEDRSTYLKALEIRLRNIF